MRKASACLPASLVVVLVASAIAFAIESTDTVYAPQPPTLESTAPAVESTAAAPECSLRKLEAQVVLYTIYRGPYDKVGQAIGDLISLGSDNGLYPMGPVSMSYLNSPHYTTPQHYLTEIRVPVADDALKLAGTLGEMTDVKTIPAMEVAVVTKPSGVADPMPLIVGLTKWMAAQGYVTAEGINEVYLSNTDSGDYAQMEVEIRIPVEKMEHERQGSSGAK
jgi:effector-binding domain-containing protein